MPRIVRPRVAASLVLAALVLPLRPVLASHTPVAPHTTGSVRIVGGRPPADGRFPFAVSLQRAAGAGAAAHFCGASLVDREWVLTAAHCVHDLTPGQFRVVVGATRLSGGDGVVRRPAEVRVDPDYDGDATHGADVALIRLADPVEAVAPVEPVRPAERARWEPGERATVVGWGVTGEAETSASDELLSASVPIQPDAVMAAAGAYGDSFRPSDMVGAGALDGGSDACFGDSGGPLVVGRGSTLRQIGIVSFGQGCGRAGHPGVYSRLGEGRVRAFADSLIPLRVAPVRVREGGTARFTFTLGRPSTLPVTVGWTAAGGTATAGVDFAAGRGVVRISPGATTATVDVAVTADSVAEHDETMRLQLGPPVNSWMVAGVVEATIVDGG